VQFASATEVWVGGGSDGINPEALMFHSKDGGATWAKFMHGIPNIIEVTDLSFVMSSNGATGFAAALTDSEASTILRFDRTHVGPSPVPPAAYFTQLTCLSMGCSLCQPTVYPQYECIPDLIDGRSITAWCGATDLVRVVYNTTDCTGPSQTMTTPVNQCMDVGRASFEFQCGSGVQRQPASTIKRNGGKS
jgi:hypothetical protein